MLNVVSCAAEVASGHEECRDHPDKGAGQEPRGFSEEWSRINARLLLTSTMYFHNLFTMFSHSRDRGAEHSR